MRCSGPGAGARSSHFEGNNRFFLYGFSNYPDKVVSVFDPFQICHNHFCIRIIFQIIDILMKVDSYCISHANYFAETHSSHFGVMGKGVDDVPALGKHRDGALAYARNSQKIHIP